MQVELNAESTQKIIESRKLIIAPGKYQVKVTSTTPYMRDNADAVVICNLAAMNNYHLEEARKAFAAGDFQTAANHQITVSPRVGKDYVPTKGELVEVVIDNVTTKNGVEGLFAVSMTPIKVTSAPAVKFSLTAAPAGVEGV